jgi:hypothetical protein
MVKKILIAILSLGVLLAFNVSGFPNGEQEENFEPQQDTEIDEATRGSAWQGGEYIQVENQLSSGGGAGIPDGISSLTDLAFQLYIEYLINQD